MEVFAWKDLPVAAAVVVVVEPRQLQLRRLGSTEQLLAK